MKKFLYMILFLLMPFAALAIDQSGTFSVPTLNLRGTIAIDEQLTATLTFTSGLTGVGKFGSTTATTTSLTYTDGATGVITRVAANQSTGTITFSGANGTYSVTTDTAASAPVTKFVTGVINKNNITISWKADASGTVSGSVPMGGEIQAIQTYNGTVEPTTLYDFTLKDSAGYDCLGGQGANVTTGSLYRVPTVTFDSVKYLIWTKNQNYTFEVTNAGANAEGLVIIYKRD